MEYLFLPRVEQGLASFAIGQPMLEHLMHCKKSHELNYNGSGSGSGYGSLLFLYKIRKKVKNKVKYFILGNNLPGTVTTIPYRYPGTYFDK